jgi:hypothetical protein
LTTSASALEAIKAKYGDVLEPSQWEALRLRVGDPGLPMLDQLARAANEAADRVRREGLADPPNGQLPGGIAVVAAVVQATQKALGDDQALATRRTELLTRQETARQLRDQLKQQVVHAEAAPTRIRVAQEQRLVAYQHVFETLAQEAETLERLYQPLRHRLESDSRLEKLSFFVRRAVDVEAWAGVGETLLDLRKPPFLGAGSIAAAARTGLSDAWATGAPAEAVTAMKAFTTQYVKPAMDARKQGVTPHDLGKWFFSTEHISLEYGIRYEGLDLSNLSPGTRGIVLLTLYLAIDADDQRPLIIDQPEENLDPKSVYASLVPFFRDSARRRQIIIVTHNANLVVTTDSDQVVVAEAQRKSPSELPEMHYAAGGLEDPRVRDLVCQYLEGGKEAFRKRSERYGFHLR